MALVPGSMVPRFRLTDGDIAEMMHPFAGHAATASGTPLAYRSAKMIFERFCMLTMPPASLICELASPPPENLGITLRGPTRPSSVFEGPVPTETAVLVTVPLALGINGFAITVAAPD